MTNFVPAFHMNNRSIVYNNGIRKHVTNFKTLPPPFVCGCHKCMALNDIVN